MILPEWRNLLDTPRPQACMADFVRIVDVGLGVRAIITAGPSWMYVAILMAGPSWTYVTILMAGP